MISGQVLLLADGIYAIGAGAEGDTLVFQDTGLSVNGLTLFKLVTAPGRVGAGSRSPTATPRTPSWCSTRATW
jgi:hypothetical protein